MSLYKRGNIWWLDVTFNGKSFRRSTKQMERDCAQEVHARFITQLRQHQGSALVLSVDDELVHNSEWDKLIKAELNKGDGGFVGLLCRRSASRAKQYGMTALLTYADVSKLLMSSNGYCTITGAPLSFSGVTWFKPSLDRIDNTKGYSLDNVRVTCIIANLAMNKWGEVALRQMCAYFSKKIMLESPSKTATAKKDE